MDSLYGRLRRLDQAGLANVLANRPDALAEPWPRRLDQLSRRLLSPESLETATAALSTPQVQVLRAIQLCLALGENPAPPAEVAHWLGTTTETVESIVDSLEERLLAWREDEGIVLPEPLHGLGHQAYGLGRSVADLIDQQPKHQLAKLAKALGLPVSGQRKDVLARIVAFFRDRDGLRTLIATAPKQTQEMLAEVAHGTPDVEGLIYSSPAAWAFERAILFGTYYSSAYMPLEVSLALRGPDYRLPFTPDEPEVSTVQMGEKEIEAASAAAALRLLDRVSTILDLAVEPFPLLKDGRIGARLIKKLAKDTGGTPGEIELAIDLAVRTDLLTVDEPEEPPRRRGKAPKPEPATLVLNTVISRPAPALLYRYLLTMWWEPPPIQFEPEDDRARALVLRLLARLEPGTGIPDVAALTRLVAWHAPTMPHETLANDVRLVIEEAELLGLVVSGAVTTTGRALLEPDNAALIKATDELVSHARTTALFGTDLTAIVPGSPDAGLAALLDRSADRETQGTATSWRFSPTSVRRAFDQGATATVLLDELSSVAQGELPQPLVYLINDVARRHGEAQVLDVASVVVGTDPALLTEIAAHRKLAKLQLRAVAPTVLTSTVDANGTLEALRDAGYAPTRHHADGSIVVPARESGSATTVVRDPEPGDAEFVPPPDPLEHAARLLAAPPTSPGLQRGQVTRAMSDRYQGRLTPMRQQLCWQLEAGIPAAVTYRADGETERLVVIYPEIDGDVLDVWSLNERTYRRLELSRIDLDQGSTDVSLA